MRFEFRDLSFAWPNGTGVFNRVNLTLEPGDRFALLGGNGSGKTTLGRCLAGRLGCSGSIRCDGRPWAEYPRSAQAALVQSVAQQPHLQLSGRGLTVREEIAFGPENLGLSPSEIAGRVDEAMELLGLARLAHRDCRHLSGGETQRTVIAGALAMRPSLLVLDEPMTDLDAETRDALAAHLRTLPWDMAVVFLDVGWQAWMVDLVKGFLVLDRGRLDGPFTPGDLPSRDLPAAIIRPGHPAPSQWQDASVPAEIAGECHGAPSL